MPDLSALRGDRLLNSTLASALIGDPDAQPIERDLRRNFARLVDKAIREYEHARSALVAQAEDMANPPEGGVRIFVFSFCDWFESCITTTHRAVNIYGRLKAFPLSQKAPRLARRLMEANSKDIDEMRNVIEHIDEALMKGEISGTNSIMVALTPDHAGAQLGPYTVSFASLASCLRALHAIGRSICD